MRGRGGRGRGKGRRRGSGRRWNKRQNKTGMSRGRDIDKDPLTDMIVINVEG